MRISRTNFYPVLQAEDDDDANQSYYPYENNGLNGELASGEEWRPEDVPVANDDQRERFRSPMLRGYDPGRYTDGSWESHFYLAPNVRFTRTPDKPAARIEDAVDAEPTVVADAAPALPSESDLLQRLREALDERRRRFEMQQEALAAQPVTPAFHHPVVHVARHVPDAPVAPAPVAMVQPVPVAVAQPVAAPQPVMLGLVVPPPVVETVAVQPIVEAREETAPEMVSVEAAIARFAHLSDHAFWETMVPDAGEQTPAEPVTVARAPIAQRPVVQAPAAQSLPAPVQAPVMQAPVVPASAAKVFAPMAPPAGRPFMAMASAVSPFMTVALGPTSVVEPPADPISIASLFRVVDVRPATSVEQPIVNAVAAETAVPVAEVVPAVAPVEQPAVQVPAALAVESARESAPSGLSRAKPFQVSMTSVTASGETYEYPPRDLLQEPPRTVGFVLTQEQLEQNAGLLESVLEDFGVRGEIIHVRPGPVVTLYEFEPAPGVKSSRVIGLADDIARSMSALSARVAVVPGRNVIGIELPNATRETVYFREMIDSPDFAKTGFKLPICLGKTIGGEPVIAELAKMPHLLVAGTTGSGKSVAINTMILSLLYRFRPDECRLIMVDPKMLELSIYDGIPHLLTPVVTDPKKAVMALKWAVREMEDRYRKMSRLGVRNIDGYNSRVAIARDKGESISITVQTGFEKGTGEAIHEEQELGLDPMPYIVVIVDEMADLMMVAGKEIEGAIQRLAQMARAAGIHLIMATQRPSVDVITGTIKANFPTRISFQVTSKIDSRTILGEQGAEQLLGQGDMLHMAGGGRISRVHGPFVSDEEVEKVVLHLKTQGRPDYLETVTAEEEEDEDDKSSGAVFDKSDMGAEDGDDLYEKAVKVVLRDRKCSTSYIQRRLAIGYNRAASLVERMEKEGLVGAANHVGKREIVSAERGAFPPQAAGEDD